LIPAFPRVRSDAFHIAGWRAWQASLYESNWSSSSNIMRNGFLRTRETLEDAMRLFEKVAALDDLQAQIRDITQFGDVRRKFQNFAGMQRRCCFSQSGPVCGIYRL